MSINIICKYYKKELKSYNEIIEKSRLYKNDLKSGKYKYIRIFNKKILYNKNDIEGKNFIGKLKYTLTKDNNLNFFHKVLNIIIWFSFKTLKIKNKNNFKASLCFLTFEGNIKLINFSDESLKTKYVDEIRYKIFSNLFKKVNSFFPTLISSFNNAKLETLERFIKNDSVVYNKQLVVSNIMDIYLKYFSIISRQDNKFVSVKNLKYKFLENSTGHKLFDKIESNVLIEKMLLPELILHGDLNLSNIIYESSQISFIDWENIHTGIFFIDIFNLIIDQHKIYNDDSLLNLLYAGHFNDFFRDAFIAFDLSFEQNKLSSYLSIYIIERYLTVDRHNEYLKNNSGKMIDRLNFYSNIIDIFEEKFL